MRAIFQGNYGSTTAGSADLAILTSASNVRVMILRYRNSGPSTQDRKKKTSHPADGGRASWEGKLRPTEATLARALGGTLADLLVRPGPRFETRSPDRTRNFRVLPGTPAPGSARRRGAHSLRNYGTTEPLPTAELPELRLADGPAEHHVVVFVRQVVAVGHVVADEGAEPAEHAGLLATLERNNVVLARVALVIRVLPRVARAVRDVMLFHVEVHRVRPAATAVVDAPGLGRADEDGRERLGGVELRPVDQPLGLAAQATALAREALAGSHGLDAEVRHRAQGLRGSGQDAVVHRRVADDDLHHRDAVVRVEADVALAGLLTAVDHLGNVRDVQHGARSELREVGDALAALRRPHLELVLEDRVREEASANRNLGPLRDLGARRGDLLAAGDLAEQPLALLAGERHRGARHEPQLVLTGDRRAEEAEAVLTSLDLEGRVGSAVDREDVADEAVVRVVAVEQLAPVLGVHVAADQARDPGIRSDRSVLVLVSGHAVIGAEVVQRHRDV